MKIAIGVLNLLAVPVNLYHFSYKPDPFFIFLAGFCLAVGLFYIQMGLEEK